ncbi:dimethylarginine dimethylaminohydrolase family protein [Aestuariivirga sp.]|jgi:N-dimethylarginine dimethylaminohydrolase|uniref:dimethylarginine dimethylaminohydrolase family protein n=1 Tax=Aestuariivirga sp. TaxID=2650926 RepID=UPI0037838DF7
MSFDFGSFNNWGQLKKVAIRDVESAFMSDAKIDAEWKDLNFHSRPDLANAKREYAQVEKILASTGAEIIKLPGGEGLTLDSIYTHDALIVTPRGLVKPRMGKAQRRKEAAINGAALEAHGLPIAGEITGEGKIEGGDLVWIDRFTLLAGVGYRTNLEGLRQLGELAGPDVEILWFDMPHYKGRSDVFHLMSCLSPLDHDLAVVYPPLMAARQIEFLEARGIDFVEVPQEEFDTMGCNVLALGPRHAMMVEGNPETERRMKAKGVRVEVIKGTDICRKGEGGPTCMTRPLVRN